MKIDWASINAGRNPRTLQGSGVSQLGPTSFVTTVDHDATKARIQKLKNWLVFRPQPANIPTPAEQARRDAAWKIEKAEIEAEISQLESTLPQTFAGTGNMPFFERPGYQAPPPAFKQVIQQAKEADPIVFPGIRKSTWLHHDLSNKDAAYCLKWALLWPTDEMPKLEKILGFIADGESGWLVQLGDKFGRVWPVMGLSVAFFGLAMQKLNASNGAQHVDPNKITEFVLMYTKHLKTIEKAKTVFGELKQSEGYDNAYYDAVERSIERESRAIDQAYTGFLEWVRSLTNKAMDAAKDAIEVAKEGALGVGIGVGAVAALLLAALLAFK